MDGNLDPQSARPDDAPMTSAPPSALSPPAPGAANQPKPAYPPPAELLTQAGPDGIRFDFNDGCRVIVPEADEPWRVRLSDLDTGNILFQSTETSPPAGCAAPSATSCASASRSGCGDEPVFTHDYSARGPGGADPCSRSARWATRSAGFPMR